MTPKIAGAWTLKGERFEVSLWSPHWKLCMDSPMLPFAASQTIYYRVKECYPSLMWSIMGGIKIPVVFSRHCRRYNCKSFAHGSLNGKNPLKRSTRIRKASPHNSQDHHRNGSPAVRPVLACPLWKYIIPSILLSHRERGKFMRRNWILA